MGQYTSQKNKAITFVGSQPRLFQYFAQIAIKDTLKNKTRTKGLLFINAWNEWGEGAHLEPDQKYGYAYLESFREALIKTAVTNNKLNHINNDKYAFCIHAFYPEILKELLSKINDLDTKKIKIICNYNFRKIR